MDEILPTVISTRKICLMQNVITILLTNNILTAKMN